MTHTEQPAETTATQQPEAPFVRADAVGPALERALERAALRDLSANRREAWRRQNAEEQAQIEHLRHERNARIDELNEEARAVNAARELALGEQRVEWVDAHAATAEAKRAARGALRAARKHDNPVDRSELDHLRRERNAKLDAIAAELRELDAAHAAAIAELREPWLEAHARSAAAKRIMKKALRELRKAEAAARAELVQAEDAARHERNDASDDRWAAVRKAIGDQTAAIAELREARQAANPDPALIEELRAREAQARAVAEHLEHEARAADVRMAQELFEKRQAASAEKALAESQLRNDWLEARYEEVRERRRARTAVRAFAIAARPDEDAIRARLRARRNAVNEAYNQAVLAIYTARALKQADIRSAYLDACAEERDIWAHAKAANKAFVESGKAEEHEKLESIRLQKNAARESFSQKTFAMRKDREIERAEEREEARAVAREVFANYRKFLAQRHTDLEEERAALP